MNLKIAVNVQTNKIPELIRSIHAKALKNAEDAARYTETLAKQIVPTDSHELQNSISAEQVDSNSWRTAPSTDYDVFVEFGTSDTVAQPYLTPAAEMARGRFLNESKKVFN